MAPMLQEARRYKAYRSDKQRKIMAFGILIAENLHAARHVSCKSCSRLDMECRDAQWGGIYFTLYALNG